MIALTASASQFETLAVARLYRGVCNSSFLLHAVMQGVARI